MIDALDARDPALVAAAGRFVRALGRTYFRLRVEGVEHVPARGPALLVGSHNGGLMTLDALFTVTAVADALGEERAVYALAHDVVRATPALHRLANRLGALRAAHPNGAAALRAGHLVLVYPGGDVDTFRPFAARGRIELGGRRGFVRLALRERAPIVPVVSAGTHEQLVVLARGTRLARALGLRRWLRADVFPIVLSLPWGLTTGLLPYVPLPAQTTVAFGAPIAWPDLGPDDADDERAVARCYDEVRAAMQARLDQLTAGRRFLLGKR